MHVLVTGGSGLLGGELIRSAPVGVTVISTWRNTPVAGGRAFRIDLADAGAVAEVFRRERPDLVIHTAYGTEDPERDILDATESVAECCARHGARLIHLSTDALLDGENAPYDESAEPDPVHEYGRWKALAERAVRDSVPAAAIVRTSLITRFEPPDRGTGWVLRSLREGTPITLFTDEVRCPIAVEDLAAQIWELASLRVGEASGVWNLAGPEAIDRHEMGVLAARVAGLDPAGLRRGLSAGVEPRRPRDLTLRTGRADAALSVRARPISEVARVAGQRSPR
jgi:dTDP-4-dehydrorhamnose reductase